MSRRGLFNYKRLIQLSEDLYDQAVEDYGRNSPEAQIADEKLTALQEEADMAAEQEGDIKREGGW